MDVSMNKIDFEKNSFFVQIIRIPLIFFLRILPSAMSHRLFIKWSSDARNASRWKRTYKALEIMYTFPERRRKREVSRRDIFWETLLDNARAVRNRLKLTEQILKNLIIECSKKTNPVQVLSLGSGSGRSLIETVAALDREISVRATLLDRSRGAIKFSQNLARKIITNGKLNNFQWACNRSEELPNFLKNYSPDIVEMVGFLDYFNDVEAIKLFRLINQHLSSGGWFIVSNIIPNLEAPFVTKGVKWPLVYRTSTQLKEILRGGGFGERKIELFIEPLKIYTIAVCQKT